MNRRFLGSLPGLLLAVLSLSAATDAPRDTRSGLRTEDFARVIDGEQCGLYVLANRQGAEVCVTNYGARVVSLLMPDRDGKLDDLVCGFPTIDGYTQHSQNFGATVGRYIGRILGARFVLDGDTCLLQAGSNGHCGHGGSPNFGARMWKVLAADTRSITLFYLSPDGENGFPGNLSVRLTYTLTDDNALELCYEATTDRPTVLNLTNHSFFNVSGRLDAAVEDQLMWVAADSITEYDAGKCVTGRLLPVGGTPFDFREPHRIGERIDEENDQLKVTRGYDHCWALREGVGQEQPVAWVYDAASGRRMEVYTTEPGLHIYTANGLKGALVGKQGIAYPSRSAVCFETCHFQNSPNYPQFPSTVLRPGETFRSRTVFKWTTEARKDR